MKRGQKTQAVGVAKKPWMKKYACCGCVGKLRDPYKKKPRGLSLSFVRSSLNLTPIVIHYFLYWEKVSGMTIIYEHYDPLYNERYYKGTVVSLLVL